MSVPLLRHRLRKIGYANCLPSTKMYEWCGKDLFFKTCFSSGEEKLMVVYLTKGQLIVYMSNKQKGMVGTTYKQVCPINHGLRWYLF